MRSPFKTWTFPRGHQSENVSSVIIWSQQVTSAQGLNVFIMALSRFQSVLVQCFVQPMDERNEYLQALQVLPCSLGLSPCSRSCFCVQQLIISSHVTWESHTQTNKCLLFQPERIFQVWKLERNTTRPRPYRHVIFFLQIFSTEENVVIELQKML